MTTTFLIDTNILVYAYNSSSKFHEISLDIIEKALNNEIEAVVADKNLFEFYAIITDKKRVELPISTAEACNVIDYLINSPLKIIFSTPFTLLKTFELIKHYKIRKQDIFDIILVAMMIENNIKNIITSNEKHFKNIKEITTINILKMK